VEASNVVPLFPQDDPVTPEEDVEAAAASVLGDTELTDAPEDPPQPFGRTWAFNWAAGRFYRRGGAPVEVRGLDSLVQWLQLARYTQRGAHAVFSDDFGMDGPEDWMGTVDVVEAASDYGARLQDAWTVHDRVASVENFEAHFEDDSGVIVIDSVDVITDTEDTVLLPGPSPLFPD
jgi:hypothetical protein